jgi:type IV pilus assembly protein PilP|tara:strand:- start:1918 stop:2295 length:378 start_codon:yes stop_codon:yes gene_type:complete
MLSISIVSTSVADDNAFGSLITNTETTVSAIDAPAAEVIDKSLHPLLQHPVKSYILMGVVISKSVKIALIRANNGEEYFIRVGDLLGNAEGTITDINGSGIEVSEENKVVSLAVRNRSASNESAQ